MHHATKPDSSLAGDERTCVLERRERERIECDVYVHIQINGAKICNCLVKNLSETGAKLLVPGGCWIPSAFDIIGLIDDLPVKARRVWNSDGEMGVSFIRGE